LGYQFNRDALSVAKRTLEKYYCRLSLLYEQRKSHPNWVAILDEYRQRWLQWVYAGLSHNIVDKFDVVNLCENVLPPDPLTPTLTN